MKFILIFEKSMRIRNASLIILIVENSLNHFSSHSVISTVSYLLVFLVLTFKLWSISPDLDPLTLPLALIPRPVVRAPVRERVNTLALKSIMCPLPYVLAAIWPEIHPTSTLFIPLMASHVEVSIFEDRSSETVEVPLLPIALYQDILSVSLLL